ncbi:MAG: hypothetical protein EAZ97_11560 [Bacteroidetes bacterium]|nr:MAG: hypothetical protein EAZ97_11560 [Bacteroidota bacterium]
MNANNQMIADHFRVTRCAWHEIEKKLLGGEIRQLLVDNLKISNYSTDVKKYWIRLLALLPNSPMENQPRYFSQKTGILHHHYALDWEIIRDLPLDQCYTLQASAYLRAILDIPKIRGMKNRFFDVEKFYEDVQNLFILEGWLPKK